MNFESTLIFLLFKMVFADLHYLDGYNKDCVACNLQPTTSKNFIISFSPNVFTRIPQVVIIPQIRGINNNSGFIGYELSITSITKTQFVVTLQALDCTVTDLTFKWVAFDDQRITVLNQFNAHSPQSTVLTHTNVNAKKGIIILLSFAGSTQITFTLQLGTIQATTVQVNIVSTGLDQIGYMILLGPDDFFAVSDTITSLPLDVNDNNRLLQNFTNVENKVQLFYIQSFSFKVDRSLHLQLLPYFGTDKCSYEFSSWGGSQASLTSCVQQQTLINFDLVSNNPLKFRKCRIANYYTYSQQNTIELTIKEISKTYSQPVTNDIVIIPSNYQQITFILTIKCVQNQQILAKYFQCTSCTYKQIKNYCYQTENVLRIQSIFTQDGVAQEQLYVTITSNQISISQNVVNLISEKIILTQYDIN